MENIASLLLYTFIPFIVVDLFVMPVAVRKNINSGNPYYNFHQKYGATRTSVLKFLIGCLAILGLNSSPVHLGKVYVTVIICFLYMGCNFIIVVLSMFALPTRSTADGQNSKNPMDSIVGFLVYPFEYLNTNKRFYSLPQKTMKWSWAAFFIPEYWYFYNEMLGAGYVSIALLMAYLGISYEISFNAAIITIAVVRVVSGLIGNRLYYAMYGKWA